MKNNRIFYYMCSFAPIIYVILNTVRNSLQTLYSQNYGFPLSVFVLDLLIPVSVSILFFYKIILQKKMMTKSSVILNIVVTMLLIAGMILFNKISNLLFFISSNPMLAFICCLQLCSLAYDIILQRAETRVSAN